MAGNENDQGVPRQTHLVVHPDIGRKLNELSAHRGQTIDEVIADAVQTLHAIVFENRRKRRT